MRADGDDLLAVFHRGLGNAFELHVLLNELDGAIGTGDDRLAACTAEPVNHRSAHDHAEQERGVQNRKVGDGKLIGQAVGEKHDDAEDHGGRADDRGSDQHGLGGGLERVAGAVVFFQQHLGLREVGIHAEVLLEVGLDVGLFFDEREFINRLRVVGHRAIAIDGDGDRAHAQEAEGHKAESEDRRGRHDGTQAAVNVAGVDRDTDEGDEVCNRHQTCDRHPADPERAEIAGGKTGENVERRPAFLAGGHNLADVASVDGGKDLGDFRNDGPCERAAGDDGCQLPPQIGVGISADGDVAHHEVGDDVGGDDRENRGEPHQAGERGFEVEAALRQIAGLGEGFINEVGQPAGDNHEEAHDEDPDKQLGLNHRIVDSEENERNEGNAGHAVGFEAVGAGANAVAGIVAHAVGDDAGVARVVFLDLEDDLHEVRADIGDLGENAASHAKGCSTE